MKTALQEYYAQHSIQQTHMYVRVETDSVVGTKMLEQLDELRMLPVATFISPAPTKRQVSNCILLALKIDTSWYCFPICQVIDFIDFTVLFGVVDVIWSRYGSNLAAAHSN